MEKMEVEKGLGDQPEPIIRDSYKIAYIIHFLLGAGNLLPWNSFITAVDYFGNLYPTKHVEKVFSVAYMSSSVVILILVMSRGGWSKKFTYKMRMNLGFSLFVLSSMVAPIIDWVGRPKGSYSFTVASIVVCGLADGLIGGSLIGSAGKLPKEYMQAVFAGTASSGVLVSILRIITKASLPQTPQACLDGPKWLRTEVPVAVLTFMLGATNGYLTSVIMILTPKSVPVSEAELSAIVLVVFLGIGLVCGSVLGWFWIV